ncbi:deoxyribonuclease II family protein [Pelomonas sp. KK5]|uniref:deoxyribonuclease II family protein n=1 Tax=Pelomonas sp. KK5 TaxID=1855730 RepID=UPI00097C1582|nr:deoxyribonuclease II family protein [Pelomonas sp. KK5]
MDIRALDEVGTAVDWWFIYKVPALSGTSDGFNYAYYDPAAKALKPSQHVLLEGKGALDRTLNAIFAEPADSVGWILYNDEVPADADMPDAPGLGHAKGLIAFDVESKTALWLLHSWPKFADPFHKAEPPSKLYGQTYMCLSLTLAVANKLAALMINHQQPQVYFPRVPKGLDPHSPLHALSRGADPNPAGDSRVVSLATRGGKHFLVIAKNRQWNKDFWNELVAPALNDDMDVETWIRGPIPSIQASDGVHHVFDIKYVDLSRLPGGVRGWAWPETRDHAKWGIARNQPWVCVGDINRMVSQEKRGGGTIALQDQVLWEALRGTDLLLLPPTKSEPQARGMILATHGKAAAPRSSLAAASPPRHVTVRPSTLPEAAVDEPPAPA